MHLLHVLVKVTSSLEQFAAVTAGYRRRLATLAPDVTEQRGLGDVQSSALVAAVVGLSHRSVVVH